MQDTPRTKSTPDENISRRKILKAVAALGGAFAGTALVPGKWSSPVVDLGVVPAHAQANSDPLELIGELEIHEASPDVFDEIAPLDNAISYSAQCEYKDPLRSLTSANTTATGKTNCSASVPTSVSYVSPERASQGYIGFLFQTALCNLTSTEFCVKINSGSRYSNEKCALITHE